MVLPGFVDVHTHLDKGHIWPRQPNPDGTFMGALLAVRADRERHWSAEDVRRRFDFALRCAYAHGTVAIRTHLDSIPPQEEITWPIFAELRQEWSGRIDAPGGGADGHRPDARPLDAAADCARGEGSRRDTWRRDGLASVDGRGASTSALDVAAEHGLDVDLHLDETQDPQSGALRLLAEAVIETGFAGKVTAGHCCSLSRQTGDEARRTIERVAQAGINIVTLPMCNLYLQDRGDGIDDAAPSRRDVDT